jgi:hypothetical protein
MKQFIAIKLCKLFPRKFILGTSPKNTVVPVKPVIRIDSGTYLLRTVKPVA